MFLRRIPWRELHWFLLGCLLAALRPSEKAQPQPREREVQLGEGLNDETTTSTTRTRQDRIRAVRQCTPADIDRLKDRLTQARGPRKAYARTEESKEARLGDTHEQGSRGSQRRNHARV